MGARVSKLGLWGRPVDSTPPPEALFYRSRPVVLKPAHPRFAQGLRMMPTTRNPLDEAGREPVLRAYLLGCVDFEAVLALQHRLVFEAGEGRRPTIELLVCEHRPVITVGRDGSRLHVRLSAGELRSRQLEVRWVGRGGGVLAHLPGQLAVYPIAPLDQLGWTVGNYLDRLQAGLQAVLADVGVQAEARAAWRGLWGRSGQLAAIGIAVRRWTTYHGAFINVAPAMEPFHHLQTDPDQRQTMSSLAVERQKHVRMATARAAVVPRLAEVFACQRYHMHTGHPLLLATDGPRPGFIARAS
jgi:lipoyl(octanoyl) transferase